MFPIRIWPCIGQGAYVLRFSSHLQKIYERSYIFSKVVNSLGNLLNRRNNRDALLNSAFLYAGCFWSLTDFELFKYF